MFGLFATAPFVRRSYADCSGCSLCFLVCPMWRESHDPRLTPEGIAKALQCGARASDLVAALEACSLCGACDPVCPERIDLPGLIMDLRKELGDRPQFHEARNRGLSPISAPISAISGEPARSAGVPLLLPGAALRAEPALLARIQALLGLAIGDDDGEDLSQALELGVEIPPARLHSFLASLRGHSIVAADGLLLRQLRRWLPGSQRLSLGAALSTRAAVRSKLAAGDLYVIEARAYHADYERMVDYYNRLQLETGCSLSLDLQRIAIPAVAQGLSRKSGKTCGDDYAQAKWILKGRQPSRIVVESLADRAAFERVCQVPVVHLAELGEDAAMIKRNPHAFG